MGINIKGKFKNKFLIIGLIISMEILICTYLFLKFNNLLEPVDIKSENVEIIISTLSLLFIGISLFATVYYYKQNKSYEIYFYIIYFTLGLILCFFRQPILLSNNKLLCNSFIISRIIVIFSILPFESLKRLAIEKRIIFFITVIFVSILISNLEIMYGFSKIMLKTNIIKYLIYTGILVYLSIISIYIWRFKKTNNFVYILLSILLLGNIIKNIYVVCYYNNTLQKYIVLALFSSYMSNIIYSFGLLYLSNISIKNKLKSIQDLGLFYDILDSKVKNKIICIYNEKKEMIYVNNEARRRYNVKENDIDFLEKMQKIGKLYYEKLSEKTRLEMRESLEKNNYWGKVIDQGQKHQRFIEVEKITSEKYGQVYLVQVNFNEELLNLKRKIEEKNKLFDIITQKSGDLICIINNEKIIKYVNYELCKVLGYSQEELIGKHINEIIKNKDYDIREMNKFEKLSLICKNNELIDIETISSKVNDKEEEGWILMARNITYKRYMENLQEKYNEIKINQQLKNEFFANLSHELKTPLNIFYSIIQVLDMNLKKEDKDFKLVYKRYNKGLKINFYRMFRMITNLIDLTKFDTNFEKVKFDNYDIVKLCEDISMSIITYASQKNIDIIFDTEKEEHTIKCNGEYMERIMLNLLSNAIKFTPRGGKICVNLNFDEKFVYIKIKDNGIGIPKENIDNIFEKFVRVDKSLSRENEGSGIGLSIVKSLVDLLGGKIYINSEENKGSEFTVKLPNLKLEDNNLINMTKKYIVDEQKITLELSDIYEIS